MWWVYIGFSFLIAIIGWSMLSSRPKTEKTRVYLASSLMPLAADLKLVAGDSLDLIFLNSSAIAKQVLEGAPCDAIILADDKWKAKLLTEGLVQPEIKNIASNTLVVASNESHGTSEDLLSFFSGLAADDKIIIGDPLYVPLGAYTEEALEKIGVYKSLSNRFILAHSARAASVLLKEKAARFAILYESDAKAEKAHVVAKIDPKLHRTIEYPFLSCKQAVNDKLDALKSVVFSDAIRGSLREKGFGLP